MEVSKEDIKEVHAEIGEVHKRIDSLVTVNTGIQIELAKVGTTLLALKIPEQPCKTLNDHLGEHQKSRNIWNGGMAGFLFGLIKMGIVLAAGYLFGKKL